MLRGALIILAASMWLATLPACQKPESTETSGTGTRSEGEASGPVLARVGDEVITVGEFQEEIDSLPEYTRKRMQGKEQKLKRLDGMVDAMLLRKEAARRGLDQDREIQRKVERYRDRLITEKLYREVAAEQAGIGEEEIRRAYEERKDQYRQKERIRASQILVLVPPNASPEKQAEAKKKVEEVLRKAKAGEDFADLAKQYSEGPTASRGGDLGYFSRGRMVPEFEEAAFSLEEPGDVSGLVKTKFGYHVIKLVDRQPEKQLTLDDVRDRIVRQLESQKRREIRQSLPEDLRSRVEVVIHEEHLETPATE